MLPNDNDCPECETWQESLNATNQVKFEGDIPNNYISSVHIYTHDEEEVLDATIDNWENKLQEINS